MANLTLHKMLLFSKEIGRHPYKYRLYFVTQASLEEGCPILHRLLVRSYRLFTSLVLGGVYSIEYSELYISSATLERQINLTNTQYLQLISLRDQKFFDAQTKKRLEMNSPEYHPANYYYTYENIRALLNYRPSFWHQMAVWACKTAAYFVSFFLPIAVYLLIIYSTSSFIASNSLSSGGAIVVPIIAIGSAPFLVWLMSSTHLFSELLMLSLDFVRYDILKSYALRWAGMRKSCYLQPDRKKLLIRTGILTFSILLVTLILALIFS